MSLENKKIIFMGTPRFASEILENLLNKGIEIDCVFTQPDKAIGRKSKLISPLVKKIAQKHDIEIFQFRKFSDEVINLVSKKKPDLIIVAAYGIILPEKILAIPVFGCINVHASLLPKLRGSSPIHNALKQGLTETGVSIMLMDKGVDTGDVFSQKIVAVREKERYLELEDKLIKASNQLLLPTLEKIINKKIKVFPQNSTLASKTKMLQKTDGRIIWQSQSAKTIFNLYRAFHIWPKIHTFWKQENSSKKKIILTIENYTIDNYQKSPGTVFKIADQILVQTIEGSLMLKTIQLEGKKELSAKNFLNGRPAFLKTILI